MSRRTHREFTEEQKQEAVRLVQSSGGSVYQVARDLGLSESTLRRWVKQSEIDARGGSSGSLTSAERLVLVASAGWSMADHLRAKLALAALSMALGQRVPGKDFLHHFDRGVNMPATSTGRYWKTRASGAA